MFTPPPPALNSPVPICTPGWRETRWESSVLTSEKCLQGIVAVSFIVWDRLFVLINTTNMIPCRHISYSISNGHLTSSNKLCTRIPTNNSDYKNAWLWISTPVLGGVDYRCCADRKLVRRDDISWRAGNWWWITRIISCHWPSPFYFPSWLVGICAGQHIIGTFYVRWLVILTKRMIAY